MTIRRWNKEVASKRLEARLAELPLHQIEIKEFVKATDLSDLPPTIAYRIDGVHVYADILNLLSGGGLVRELSQEIA